MSIAYIKNELLARLVQCGADREGEDGMFTVAFVIVNCTRVPYGEFLRVSEDGSVRRMGDFRPFAHGRPN